jgi:hypothetical protein
MYANAIKSLGADALKITQRFRQYKYHAMRKSQRGTGMYAPSAELYSPSGTR